MATVPQKACSLSRQDKLQHSLTDEISRCARHPCLLRQAHPRRSAHLEHSRRCLVMHGTFAGDHIRKKKVQWNPQGTHPVTGRLHRSRQVHNIINTRGSTPAKPTMTMPMMNHSLAVTRVLQVLIAREHRKPARKRPRHGRCSYFSPPLLGC